MNTPRVVALIGFAHCGKSTVAGMLADMGYTRLKFAAPLKDMLRSIGLTDYEIEGAGKERPCALLAGRTPRHAMVTLGTEWGRDLISPEFWTGIAAKRARDVLAAGGRVVFDDCRFENEGAVVRALGGEVWRVVRPGHEPAGALHPSEAVQLGMYADRMIVNVGPMETLREAVEWELAYGDTARAVGL